jgi:anti-sigma factor RsiW
LTASTPCPERIELERVLLGLLPETQAEQLEQHVLECPRCVATMVEMGAGDTLVEAMRAGPAAAAEMAGYRDQVRVVVDRWVAARGAPVDATPSASAADDPTSELGPRRTFVSDGQDEAIDFLAPPQAADELGRLGNYRVLRVLGTGGMGLVFEAEDMQLKRRVALKAMRPSLAASGSSRRRFVREAQVAASVEHDHIVPIYQVGDDRGIPFIAMPLLRGETLADRLARGAGSVGNALPGVPPSVAQGDGEIEGRKDGEKEGMRDPQSPPLSVSPSLRPSVPPSLLLRFPPPKSSASVARSPGGLTPHTERD